MPATATANTNPAPTPNRRRARVAGIVYLVTFVTSIPALALKTPALDLAAPFTDAAVSAAIWAGVLEIVLALACVGTAVALHPVIGGASPVGALGFVAARTVEAALVLLGVVALLTLVDLRTAGGEAADAVLPAVVGLHDGAFLLGPGLIPAVNAALLAPVLLRTGLVPRAIPVIGLVAVPLLAASALGTVLGVFDQVSAIAGVLALPVAAWELSLGLWLTVRGVRAQPSSTTSSPVERVIAT